MSKPAKIEQRRAGIAQIRKELSEMWAEQAKNDQAVLRAATHNLVVYVSDQATAEQTTQRVIELTAQRPGRVIVLDVEPGETESLDAWVTIFCRPSGNRQVCGEIITLAVRGALRNEADNSVMALLAPDLPVYLWWAGKLDPHDSLFQRLAGKASRVIIDSSATPESANGLLAASQIHEAVRISDLSWARLTPWRRLLTRLWDSPTLRTSLGAIRSLDIHHISADDWQHSDRALLLLGWLADRLGWELAEAQAGQTGGYVTRWRSGDWETKAEIVESKHSALEHGEIRGIYVQAGEEPPYAMPSLAVQRTGTCIEERSSATTGGPSMIHRFVPVSVSEALAEELDFGYDPLYRGALRRAVEIVQACHQERRQRG